MTRNINIKLEEGAYTPNSASASKLFNVFFRSTARAIYIEIASFSGQSGTDIACYGEALLDALIVCSANSKVD